MAAEFKAREWGIAGEMVIPRKDGRPAPPALQPPMILPPPRAIRSPSACHSAA
jgi:hypothetical protein